MSRAAAEADRRIGAMVNVGTVVAVNTATGRVRVRMGDLETADIPVMQILSGAVRLSFMPGVGDQVSVLAPSGDLARAFVMGSLPIDGNSIAPSPGEPTMDLGGGTLRVIGTLWVDGDIQCTGDVVAGAISLTSHTHPENGSTTGEPQ